MAPIDESGGVWEYTPSTSEWALLSPRDSSREAIPEAIPEAFPEAIPEAIPEKRSFHCLTDDGCDTLYLHAGCPEKGRLSDLWAFKVSDSAWTRLGSAPEPGRGGTSIAFTGTLLYRMNGFNGKNELGGALDIYNRPTNSRTSHAYLADGQSVRAMAIKNEQSPVSPGLVKSLLVEQALQPAQTKLITCPSIRLELVAPLLLHKSLREDPFDLLEAAH
ncbi:hypothetical protein B0A55_12201 [Friedmanniomyces simplex]|uniref:Uncharacterized protein n=1 Tax=Friedmanniomyces simplex TaxID=329884 RepID=A0A4U0WJY4_9PEZI|nr:hypothetical protein B0A55_12201 [Friedmanniomyces simplex]